MKLHVITPVKDSIDTTLQTIDSIYKSKADARISYSVYNDYSSDTNTEILEQEAKKRDFNLINLKDITTHPSPNYLLILQLAQQKALAENAHLIIIESDVIIEEDTIDTLFSLAKTSESPGLLAAVTVDESGEINFPYHYARKYNKGVIKTNKRLSFCCTLLTNEFLSQYNFQQLDPQKNWYDIFISHKATQLGFKNYLLTSHSVLHKPHGSRSWKKLKYTNPIKYYWQKITRKRDRI